MSNPNEPDAPEDLIRYDILAQEALRGVVKKVLSEVASTGALPGEHHFYITFDTKASGVRISERMRGKYPDEMTIVVQHQFWDLKTNDSGFSIGLSFNEIPESLSVPFAAVTGFFDPSVQFGLQFDATPEELTLVQDAEDQPVSALVAQAGAEAAPDENDDADGESAPASADVVSLDAFRKK